MIRVIRVGDWIWARLVGFGPRGGKTNRICWGVVRELERSGAVLVEWENGNESWCDARGLTQASAVDVIARLAR